MDPKKNGSQAAVLDEKDREGRKKRRTKKR